MKKILLIIYILPLLSYSQKYDNVWFMGGVNNNGNASLNFSNIPPIADSLGLALGFTHSSYTMCDSLGNVLFYSNGFNIANASNIVMDNGVIVASDTSLNFPLQNQSQSTICLPQPGSNHLFYQIDFFYDLNDPTGFIYCKQLRYSIIDIQANNGLGKVIAKNLLLINDTLGFSSLTAVKHGNGKDWWIVIPEYNSHNFYRILLDETGFSSPIKQSINPSLCAKNTGGLAIFLPNGSQYIYDNMEGEPQLQFYDFDRCTGEISFKEMIPIPYRQYERSYGLAISPNNQFLYCGFSDTLYQFDLTASIIANTQTIVATDTNQWHFNQMQLAPDGKVYVDITNNIYPANFHYMGIINNPNTQGIACNYVDKQIRLAPYNLTPPHYPNYRLEALHNPCAVGIAQSQEEGNVNVYPNPVDDILHIRCALKYAGVTCEIQDMLGRRVESFTLTSNADLQTTHSIAHLQAGIYFVKIQSQLIKLIISH